ncbi:MAG: hypothetical protein GY941_26760, partial [Planctomycetes bacterium]|nr:hypothetical protein [Planctomycetota bacterium]
MIRINQLAKDLGTKSSLLIEKCHECGLMQIKHHANSLTSEQERLVRSKLKVEVSKEGTINQGKQSTTIERTNKKAREDVSATSNAKAGTIPAKTGIIPAKTGAAPAKSGTAPTKEGRRVPPWKLKAREGLIKGRWKDVTRVS